MNDPWWKTLGRILWWIFSRPWAAFMAVGWPLMIAYGLVQPRTVDLAAMHVAATEVALWVGSAGDGRTGQRSYIVLPRALATGAVTVVTDGSPPMAEEVAGGLIMIFLVWVTCVYLTWRFCWRPIRSAWRTQDRARA